MRLKTFLDKELYVALVPHDPTALFAPYRGYTHAMEVAAGSRLLFISGLNGFEQDGRTMPETFDAQAELIWRHIRAILASAGMGIGNLVSLRTYLADPGDDDANARMREKQLGGHRVASTVVCCRLLESTWKLEVEAVAAGCET
jgi:enamine deaminase RidA (YjgF/YER057c/UK114 family)